MAENSNFKTFLKEKRTWYNSIGAIYCPALGMNVSFNKKGFSHLRYNSFGKPRKEHDQRKRLNLITHAPFLLKRATTISATKQEYLKGRTRIQYWSFDKLIKRKKLRAIVRQEGLGTPYFYSIMQLKR